MIITFKKKKKNINPSYWTYVPQLRPFFFLAFWPRPVVPKIGRTFLEETHDLIGRGHTGVVVGLRGLGAHLLLGEDQPLAEPSAQR